MAVVKRQRFAPESATELNAHALVPEHLEANGPLVGLPTPTFLPRRYKPRNVGEWTGHLTFASDLILALEPGLIVELGTHWGEAYFTFCQTVQEHGLSTVCYAVDHWLGDEHAGHYGEEVFGEVSQYNQRLYRHFSYLLRKSFDEALTQFADQSIDLLHIDGLHTYEAVCHDFRGWLPKMRPGGVILLHDICPRHEDFGVWRLWEEIKAEFPDTFEFHHSWGLGVVRVNGGADGEQLTKLLFESPPEVREDIRRHYVIYASHLEHVLGRMPSSPAPQPAPPSDIRVEVFPWMNGGHSPEFCQVRKMPAGSWNTLSFDLRYPGINGPLRVDPGCEPSLIEVGEVLIHSLETGKLVWKSEASSANPRFQLGGTAVGHPANPSLIINSGDDPLLLLDTTGVHGPFVLSINLKVVPLQPAAMEIVQRQFLTAMVDAANALNLAEQDKQRLTQERDGLTQERERLATDIASLQSQSNQMVQERDRALSEIQHLKDLLMQMQHSASWRITSPLRKVMATLRGGKS